VLSLIQIIQEPVLHRNIGGADQACTDVSPRCPFFGFFFFQGAPGGFFFFPPRGPFGAICHWSVSALISDRSPLDAGRHHATGFFQCFRRCCFVYFPSPDRACFLGFYLAAQITGSRSQRLKLLVAAAISCSGVFIASLRSYLLVLTFPIRANTKKRPPEINPLGPFAMFFFAWTFSMCRCDAKSRKKQGYRNLSTPYAWLTNS